MKRIEAIISEDKLDAVFDALLKLDLGGFTYSRVSGRGKRPRPMVPTGRSGRLESTYNINADIFVVVPDDRVNQVIDAITDNASTGLSGEGKVFVSNIEDSVDVGTKKHGNSSL
ncbi:MAG: P-II family nitrogen regulator [Thaumarchaeota archaeon]|nr:P-II family nitrogen regulator [Nitrososphaerota archaeon]